MHIFQCISKIFVSYPLMLHKKRGTYTLTDMVSIYSLNFSGFSISEHVSETSQINCKLSTPPPPPKKKKKKKKEKEKRNEQRKVQINKNKTKQQQNNKKRKMSETCFCSHHCSVAKTSEDTALTQIGSWICIYGHLGVHIDTQCAARFYKSSRLFWMTPSTEALQNHWNDICNFGSLIFY